MNILAHELLDTFDLHVFDHGRPSQPVHKIDHIVQIADRVHFHFIDPHKNEVLEQRFEYAITVIVLARPGNLVHGAVVFNFLLS